MPIYTYVCDECHGAKTLLRKIDERNDPVHCETRHRNGARDFMSMRRTLEMPAVHFKGFGFTRQPAILSDPIAAGVNRQQRSDRINWGTQDGGAFGSAEAD